MKIAVLGAGAWGTALALSASRHASGQAHHVSLWARDPAQAEAMARQRVNNRYLPGHPFPPSLAVPLTVQGDSALRTFAEAHDLLILATPVAGLRHMLHTLHGTRAPIAWLCKGFESPVTSPFGLLPHEVHAEVTASTLSTNSTGVAECAVLNGPSFAAEVANGQPTALVAASHSPQLRQLLVNAFHSPALRVYASDDVVGVEVGGAVKNVLAIATGLCDGLQLGLNARAALITRGLAEMTRLGLAMGAKAETFMGLSGLGDLVLTATGDLSRNRKVGLLLASGKTLTEAVTSLGHVAEGVYCARTVVQRARLLGVEMPIAESVVSLLGGECSVQEALGLLMGRGAKAEV